MAAQVLPISRRSEGVTTAELVERARARDATAEGLLYRRHAGELLGIISRLLKSHSAAEDVVHDTFLLAFERLGQLREPSQFRAWALSIAVSLVRKRIRRQRLLVLVGMESVSAASLETFARDGVSVEARGELAVLGAVIDRLPPDQKLAWSLRYIEGEKLEDVAVLINKSLATTKRYIAAAEESITRHVSVEPPP